MAVNLSPVGGVAAQFFTNNGVPLAGGKLYTYAAGTTTPQTTYSTYTGAPGTERTNPIVLDSAGRVPSGGEIWLTQNTTYKFVLKDSNDVTIATYDNISGISDLTLPIDSSNITYDPPFASSVATNVEARLAQYVSVKDFGAVGDGIADDTNAIQNALTYASTLNGTCVYMPAGKYKITSTLSFQSHSTKLYGANRGYIPGTFATDIGGTRIVYTGTNYAISFNNKQYCEVADLTIKSTTASGGIYIGDIAHFFRVSRVVIDGQSSGVATGFTSAGIAIERSYYGTIEGCDIAYCSANGIYGFRECNGNFFQMNSLRQCGTGIRITDTTSNSDGCSIISNEIESARTDPGSGYGIALVGADSNMIVGNRLEWTSNGHIYVNSGVGVAQFNQVIGNVMEGPAPAIVLGDGTGTNQVVGTFISGGRAATAVTINSDCIYTRMEAAPSSYGGTLTDNGFGSIVHIDINSADKWYEKSFASASIGHEYQVGGAAATDNYKANYHRIDFTNLADAFQHRALNAGGTWLAIFQMGAYRLWVSPTNGKLYINGADPTTPTDGTVVGTQT